MELLNGMQSGCEGNISWFENRQEKIVEIIKEIKPKNLIEIGFNVGHSALLICNTISDLKKQYIEYSDTEVNFYIFDICSCVSTKSNFEILKNNFKENLKLHLIEGDSLLTVSSFLSSNNILFDFIEVDGCHTYDCVIEDIRNTIDSLNKNGIMYIDDYKSVAVPIVDVDNGVDSFDWSNFKTEYIDGVFLVRN